MFVGAVVMFIVLLLPLAVIAALDNPDPELRVLMSQDFATTLIVDRSARILIVNTPDRELAHSLSGRLARPWEPRPHMLIAPANDNAAIGLLESIQIGTPEAVLIAGIPGAHPLWNAIERECRERGIDLRYVTGRASVSTSRLNIHVIAPEPEKAGERAVVVERGDTRLVVALDTATPSEPSHVLIGVHSSDALADLIITGDDRSRSSAIHEVIVDSREIVTISMSSSTIRVFGGALRIPAAGVGRQ